MIIDEFQLAALVTISMGVGTVTTPLIKKVTGFCWKKTSLLIHKKRQKRNLHTSNTNHANKAVRDALKAWDYAEYEYEEKRIKQAKAYGGYYPTIRNKIECWEDVVTKCREAAELLELIGEKRRTIVVGICEATRRELEGEGRDRKTY